MNGLSEQMPTALGLALRAALVTVALAEAAFLALILWDFFPGWATLTSEEPADPRAGRQG
jgi:hypothetical protein